MNRAPRLKSLELHGYKTFASRIDFEFSGVITAIVGPNGSGKSNIADSLRWVLGEQSYSLLRGRKTEDMIFAGSEQRPRASMAQATITFDNADGWLPIDFAEVSLTRRAYRDGQNEYLLNGQRVRLKEIAELLAQSGLAERTYTIIGQGLVDAALSLKPEERRRFFEEAAGIGLYRSRREESLSRLETTQRNLDRVQDILSELVPRLASLEKQSRRVIEYERVKADLRLLLRDWYGFHWHRVQRELAQAREVARTHDALQRSARDRLDAVEASLEAHRQRVQSARASLNELHARSADLHRQREKLSRDLAVMDERQRAYTGQDQSLEADLGRLEEERSALLEQQTTLAEELAQLRLELQDAQKQGQQAQAAFQARSRERERLEQQVRETRRLIVAAETRQVQLRAHLNELSGRQANLDHTLASTRQALIKEIQALNDGRARLEEAAGQRARAEAARAQVEEEIAAHRKSVQESEAARRTALDARSAHETDRARLKAQIEVLEQAERSFSGLNQGAKTLLQAARQGRLGGRVHALSALLHVPAEVETAVAAVLGEFLDGVLLSGGGQVEEALQLLEQGEKGRAVLFTRADAPPSALDAPLDDPDCLGLAAALVHAPDEFAPLVQSLLGRTLLVRTRAAARRLLPALPPTARLVTLRGEVFYPNGVVIAGQDGRSGLVSRPRQKKELQDRLAAVEDLLASDAVLIAELDHQAAAQREAAAALDERLRQAGRELAQLTQAAQQASLTVEQSKQRHDWQRSQITSLEGQLKRAAEEIQQQTGEVEKAAADVQKHNETLRQLNRALLELPIDELQAQLSHWSTAVAVAERAVRESQRRGDEHQRRVASNQGQIDSLSQRIEQTRQAARQLVDQKSALLASEGALNSEIETLQVQITPAETELVDLEAQYTSMQEDQAAAQQAVMVADRHATQAQLELTRSNEALTSLHRRIEEDFGLVALEYAADMSGQTPLPLAGMVEQLPMRTELSPEIDEAISRQRTQLRRMGAINPDAHREYLEVKERHDFLVQQVADLKKADADLRQVITELDDLMRREFRKTFDAVAAEFKVMFTRLFGGGAARLVLTDEDHPAETGIDIEARLPGRREQGLSLLSGGERSLTAVALVFALLKTSPTPFCVLDEVDAMLDEANVGRFCDLLRDLSQRTQFIVITHNRNTVQSADVIYGVTMGRDSASQLLSLRLDEVSEEMVR